MEKFSKTTLLSLSAVAGTYAATLVGCGTPGLTAVDPPAVEETCTECEACSSCRSCASCESTATPTALSKQLEGQVAASAAKFPEAIRSKFQAGIDIVRNSGIEESAKQVGDAAVDGELIGWDGETVLLSDLWKDGPVILMWYRGGWCPYCNIQLRAMQQSLDQIEDAGARLVVLTPELPEKAKETAANAGIDMVALHDRNNELAQGYGIRFDLPEPIVPIYRDKLKLPSYNGSDAMQLPLAATYVINTSGEITYAFLDADYKKRAEPSEVVDAVRSLSK